MTVPCLDTCTCSLNIPTHLITCIYSEVLSKIMRSFSVFTNLASVMSTETKQDSIACLHGVRVLTMLWIVLGNTYLYMTQSIADVPVAGTTLLQRTRDLIHTHPNSYPWFITALIHGYRCFIC